MILADYVKKMRIHPILILFIFISLITGTFVDLFIIVCLVFIHEWGHFMMATFFKWRIQTIMLWVFGGVMKTDEHGSTSIKEDILVTLAGPLQHLWIYGLIFILAGCGGLYDALLPPYMLHSLWYYNTLILCFNLIPIWPLDGGKLLFAYLSFIRPYRQAYEVTILLSMLVCIGLLVVPFLFDAFTLSSFLLFLFLLMENRNEWKYRYYVFIRFLLNRYEGYAPIRKIQALYVPYELSLMDVFHKFRRDQKHPIYVLYPKDQRQLIDEQDCLRSYFHDKNYRQTIGELASHHSHHF